MYRTEPVPAPTTAMRNGFSLLGGLGKWMDGWMKQVAELGVEKQV